MTTPNPLDLLLDQALASSKPLVLRSIGTPPALLTMRDAKPLQIRFHNRRRNMRKINAQLNATGHGESRWDQIIISIRTRPNGKVELVLEKDPLRNVKLVPLVSGEK